MTCYTCDIFTTFDTAQQAMSSRLFSIFGSDADSLLTALVGVWTAYFFIMLMLHGADDIRDVVKNVVIFTFSHTLIANQSSYDYYIISTIRDFVFTASVDVAGTSARVSGSGVTGVISSVEGSLTCVMGIAAEAGKSWNPGLALGGIILLVPYVIGVVIFTVGLVEFLFILFFVRGFGPLVVLAFSFKMTRSISGNAIKMLAQGGLAVLFAASLAGLSLEVMARFGGFVPGSCGGGWSNPSEFMYSDRYFAVMIFGIFNLMMMMKSVGWAGQIVSFFASSSAQLATLGTIAAASKLAMAGTRLAGKAAVAQGRVTASANAKAPWAQGGGGDAQKAGGGAGGGGGAPETVRPPWADGGRSSQGRGLPKDPVARASALAESERSYKAALDQDAGSKRAMGRAPTSDADWAKMSAPERAAALNAEIAALEKSPSGQRGGAAARAVDADAGDVGSQRDARGGGGRAAQSNRADQAGSSPQGMRRGGAAPDANGASRPSRASAGTGGGEASGSGPQAASADAPPSRPSRANVATGGGEASGSGPQAAGADVPPSRPSRASVATGGGEASGSGPQAAGADAPPSRPSRASVATGGGEASGSGPQAAGVDAQPSRPSRASVATGGGEASGSGPQAAGVDAPSSRPSRASVATGGGEASGSGPQAAGVDAPSSRPSRAGVATGGGDSPTRSKSPARNRETPRIRGASIPRSER
jgi:hypothetical protein